MLCSCLCSFNCSCQPHRFFRFFYSFSFKRLIGCFLLLVLVLVLVQNSQADWVKVTPLGSHDGEFCRLDRALIFEVPQGTQILYDAGRTVAGANDSRLGRIDVILVSHVHGDHVGDKHINEVNAGCCAKPGFSVVATPHSNTVHIAVAKGAKIVTGSEMPRFFAGKLLPATRTGVFVKATEVPVHIPLSGKTMSFDGNGQCVAGC